MGITGWIHHQRDLRDERPAVNAMAAALHPVPMRADVVRLSRRAGLAHRGLAGGYADWRHLERPDPDLAVVIDGELSNRRLVEEQLYQRPRLLCSDAEVLLHAYRAWGAGMVQRIDGTYTIALWDNHARQLLLIRDPLGAKTVFYTIVAGGLVFASRASALLVHPDVKPVVDTDGLNELITLAGVRTPGHGVINGVAELLPGEMIRHTPAGVRRHRHWALEAEDHGQDIDATVNFVRCALAENTGSPHTRQPGAVLLSGGVASAAAAALTTGAGDHRPAAWTLTFTDPSDGKPDGLGSGELAGAAQAAQHLRLRHTSLALVDADAFLKQAAAAGPILDFPGEPDRDAGLFAVLRTAAIAGATTVVTGDGADAVFGGYPWPHQPGSYTDDFPWRRRGVAPADLLTRDARRHLLPGAYRQQRYADAAAHVAHLPTEDAVARRHRTASALTLTHYLPHLLTRIGQLADAAGLALRTPFADWLLAQYLHNTPTAIRNLCGIPNGLLRHTVADLLPPAVTWRPATPFPRAHLLRGWRHAQRIRLHTLLANPNAPLQPLLDQRRTRDLLAHPPTVATSDWHATVAYLLDLNDWLNRHHISLT